MSSGAIRAGRAFVELFLDDSKLARGLNAAAGKVKKWGNDVAKIGASMALVSGAITAPLLAAAKTFASSGDELAKMSRKTGMSVEALSELKYAAGQSGVGVDTLEGAIKRMQKSIAGMEDQAEGTTGKLDRLGLTAADVAGKSPEKQFSMIAEAISRIADPTDRAAAAMSVFGRSGTALLPMIEGGAAGIDALCQKARALGLTMTSETAAAGQKLQETLKTLWATTANLTETVGGVLAPVLTAIGKSASGAAISLKELSAVHPQLISRGFEVAASITAMGTALILLGKVAGVAKYALAAAAALATPFGIVGAAIAGAVGIGVFANWERLKDVLGGGAKSAEDMAIEFAREKTEVDQLVGRLQALSDKQSLSNDEMKIAAGIVDDLAKKYGILGAKVDQAAGKVQGFGLVEAQAADTAAAKRERAARWALSGLQADQEQNMRDIQESWTAGGQQAAMTRFQNNIPRITDARKRLSKAEAAHNAASRDVVDAMAGKPTRAEQARTTEKQKTKEAADDSAWQVRMSEQADWEKKAAEEAHKAKIDAIDNEALREGERINEKYAKERAEGEKLGADLSKIDEARETELGALYRRVEGERAKAAADAAKEAAEKQQKGAEQVAGNQADLQEQIARAGIEATLTGREKEMALLEVERKKMLSERGKSGLKEGDINELFRLKAAGLDTSGESRYSVAGTFSGYAAGGLGGGSNVSRIATATEQAAKLLQQIARVPQPKWGR